MSGARTSTDRRWWGRWAGVAAAGAACCLGGCLERTVTVTSEPPGAVVWLNDVEVGRTPVKTAFTYYGVYDVRLRREGYEPLNTSKNAKAPLAEVPPVDIFTTAWPGRVKTNLVWHFDLKPVEPQTPEAEKALIERAGQMREKVAASEQTEGKPAEAAPAGAAPTDGSTVEPGGGAAR